MTDRNLSGRINRSQIGNQTRSGDAGVKFLNAQELAAAGVARLSIGIETVADILADIEQALAASVG